MFYVLRYSLSMFVVAAFAADLEFALQGSFGGRPVPTWHNGFLTAVLADRKGVEVFDRTGLKRTAIFPSPPTGSSYQIRNASARSDGTVAITMLVRDSADRLASVIGWYAITGEEIRIVATEGFAGRVAFAPDGVLWSWGRAHNDRAETIPGHDLIRRYGPNGQLLGTSLPITSFLFDPKLHPAGECFFSVGESSAAFVSLTTQSVVLLNKDGNEIERRALPELSLGEFISGVALLRGNDLMISAQGPEAARYLVLQRGRAGWENASFASSRSSYTIIGADAGHPVTYGVGRVSVRATLN